RRAERTAPWRSPYDPGCRRRAPDARETSGGVVSRATRPDGGNLPVRLGGKDMEDISPSDLKTILHSKRANLYYMEHCRVLVNGGRVEYVTDAGKRSLYWNIPIANTTTILLGTGTSITQAAMRELAKAGVLVGFCGGGGTPLFSANGVDFEVVWFSPQSE